MKRQKKKDEEREEEKDEKEGEKPSFYFDRAWDIF